MKAVELLSAAGAEWLRACPLRPSDLCPPRVRSSAEASVVLAKVCTCGSVAAPPACREGIREPPKVNSRAVSTPATLVLTLALLRNQRTAARTSHRVYLAWIPRARLFGVRSKATRAHSGRFLSKSPLSCTRTRRGGTLLDSGMFSSPRTFRDATANTEQYQRSRQGPEQRRDAMAARHNCAENLQRFPLLSSDTAPSSPHRRGLEIPYTQASMYRTERQLPSPPLEADFRSQRASTMSDATQAVKASLAPSIPSLQSARPPQSFTGSCEPCAVVEAGHSSQPRLVEHNGQAQVTDRTVRRRSLRRPQPLQGIGARSLYASDAPSTPSMTDARSLYGSPGRRPATFGNETSAASVRTAGRGSSDLSPKRSDSSSPEADARKRGKSRLTAEERAASGQIPRPPNSFMLYRSAQNKLLSQLRSQEGDKLQQADLCECRRGKGFRTFLG